MELCAAIYIGRHIYRQTLPEHTHTYTPSLSPSLPPSLPHVTPPQTPPSPPPPSNMAQGEDKAVIVKKSKQDEVKAVIVINELKKQGEDKALIVIIKK